MGILTGKKGIIMGIANERSIAAAVAQVARQEGAELGFSFLPDDRGKMKQRVLKVVGDWQPKLLHPCDINSDEQIKDFFAAVKDTYGTIDFLVHSIAFAPLEDIRCSTIAASRKGFLTAMDASVYSFIATARAAAELMSEGGAMITMSYFGGEKVVAGYNLMGVAKAALECAIKYLAFDLGPQGIRVNGVSAGPIKTLAASAVGDFGDMLGMYEAIAPLERNVTAEEVGKTSACLLSDFSSGVTGELVHVDGGYHAMGSPGRAFARMGVRPKELNKP